MDSFNWAGFSFPHTSPEPITGSARGAYGFYLGECKRMRWTWADDISGAGIRHTGWFCDEFQDHTIRGIVVRLTHGRMLAGWSMGAGMASLIACDEVFTDEIEAARRADGLAESAADAERELICACIVTARDSREQLINEYSDIEV